MDSSLGEVTRRFYDFIVTENKADVKNKNQIIY
jgi:hypothetical protein